MNSKFKTFMFPIVLLMSAFIFLATGVYAGYAFASMRGETSAWACITNGADTYVRSLNRLKRGNIDEATVGLEAALDLHVVLMDGSDRKDVRKTLLQVKNYRVEHPWSGAAENMSSKVGQILADVK